MRSSPRGLPPGTLSLIDRALKEDRVRSDRTTELVLPKGRRATADVVAQADGVLSGVVVAATVARRLGVKAVVLRRDGALIRAGAPVLRLTGDARKILAVERTLLNFLMHLSGVATTTARVVADAGAMEVRATRKTTPGLRDLEKRAVVDGGGAPHRRDLSEAVLVKNNHLALVPLPELLSRLPSAGEGRPSVQVEVRSLAEAREAVAHGVRSLLIDNATPRTARTIVSALESDGTRPRVHVELSGGITLENVRRYRRVGADAVSLGSLTHSAPALPFHLSFTGRRRGVASGRR